ncbi:large exoprotein containing haemagglutination activity domain [Thioploca ingrica]|uniref:Large exoprotein containing haemagglutination activity domain n=1 Tax=Thioploca ingrica TaxID=40754 RepID=A0A090AFI8_9GAMM|nr:large exoprotein containing haemagglutination activity domain [Thioploca ingrica]
MRCHLITGFGWLSVVSLAHGEVVFDGTLGTTGSLPGPNFVIDAPLGQQVGDNLFHSFERFNLDPTESATFTGPATINNVINRVTGGQPSHINGLFRSQIPQANFYFINPAGILFGPQAQIDVPASLYLSTADYLQLGATGQFNATLPNNTLLSVAAPTAFGFLDHPSPITVQNSQLNLTSPTDIKQAIQRTANPNHTLAFIGGDITIQDSVVDTFGSNINIVSVDSAGEAPVDTQQLTTGAFTDYGTVRISDADTTGQLVGNLQTSGRGGGAVFIRAGQFFLEGGWIFADTLGDQPGRGITIQVDKEFALTQAARVTTEVADNNLFGQATGTAGPIDIRAEQLQLTAGSQIASTSYTASTAGNINLSLKSALFLSGMDQQGLLPSAILSNATRNGSGGQINITAPQVRLEQDAQLQANTLGEGEAGNLSLQVNTLEIRDGAQIAVGVGDQRHVQGAGKGGQLTITAADAIRLQGKSSTLNQPSGLLSNVFTLNGSGGQINLWTPQLIIEQGATIQALTLRQGHAGSVNLQVSTLELAEGGTIRTNTLAGSGPGGHIEIVARQAIKIKGNNTGITAATDNRSSGQGGEVRITTGQLTLADGGALSVRSDGVGNAGNIELTLTDKLRMQQGSIRTSAARTDGGNINITVPNYLQLTNSEITTSVNAQAGNGGNITLNSEFVILNHSHIFAQAISGEGGNINITTTGIYNLSSEPLEQVINASSRFGIDGVVEISSPDQDVSENLVVLPATFFDASKLFITQCNKLLENTDSLSIKPLKGSPPSPYDWKANYLWNPSLVVN